MENIKYEIVENDNSCKTMDKHSTKSYIKDFAEDIFSIKKSYQIGKKTYFMTLFSIEHDFSAQEYIDHYKNLSDTYYGKDFMNDFDIYVIKKLNP